MDKSLRFGIAVLSFFLVAPSHVASLGTTDRVSPFQSGNVWRRYRIDDAEFSVALPVVPAMTSYSAKLPSLSKNPVRHEVGAYQDGMVYAIDVFDRKESLDSFVDAYQRSTGARFKRDVTVDGVKGREYELTDEHRRSLTQFFSTSHKIYLFAAWGSSLVRPDERTTKFLSSISFTPHDDDQLLMDGAGEAWTPPPDYEKEAGTEILSGKVVSTKPIVVSKPEPIYSETARQNGVSGTVVIRGVFRSSGLVTNLHVVSGLPDGLTDQAVAVAGRIKFIPATKDGHFVSMWMELQYNFSLY